MQTLQELTKDISCITLTKAIVKCHLHNLKLIARINRTNDRSLFENELESREIKSISKLKEQCEDYVERVQLALDSLTIVHRDILIEEFYHNRRGHQYHHYSRSSFYRYRKQACQQFVEAFNSYDNE